MGKWQNKTRRCLQILKAKAFCLKVTALIQGNSQRGSAELCSHLSKGCSTERLNCKVNICSFPKLIQILFQLHTPCTSQCRVVIVCGAGISQLPHRQSAFCPLTLIPGEKKHLKNLKLFFLEADWWIWTRRSSVLWKDSTNFPKDGQSQNLLPMCKVLSFLSYFALLIRRQHPPLEMCLFSDKYLFCVVN